MYGVGQMDLLQAGSSYLMIPAVQKEIGLSPAVAKKMSDRMTAATKAMMAAPPKDPAQRQKVVMERMKQVQAVQKENLKMLTPAQQTRLRQITIQQLGLSAMMMPEVKTALKLTLDQERKIGVIMRDGMQRLFSGMQGASTKNQADFQKRMQEFQKKQEKAKVEMIGNALKLMNPTQRAKWASLQGKPFKLDMVKAMSSIMPRRAGS